MRMTITVLLFFITTQLLASEIIQEAKGLYTINSVDEPTNKEKQEAVKLATLDAKAKAVEKIGSLITVTREISSSNAKELHKSKRSIMSASSAVVKHYVKDVKWFSDTTVAVTITAYVSEENVYDVLKRSSKNLEEMNKIAKENEKILAQLKETQKELKENAQKVRYKKLSLQSAKENELVLGKKRSELISRYDNFSKKLIVAMDKDYVKKSLIKTKLKIKNNKIEVEDALYENLYKPYISGVSVSVSNVEFIEMEDGRIKMYFDISILNTRGFDRKALSRSEITKGFKVGGAQRGQKMYYHLNGSIEIQQYVKKYLDENGVAVVLRMGDEEFYGEALFYNADVSSCCMTGEAFVGNRVLKRKMQIVTSRDVIEYTNGEFTVGAELVGNRLVGIGEVRSSYVEKSSMGRNMLMSVNKMEPAKY